jgi:hypothetical protein
MKKVLSSLLAVATVAGSLATAMPAAKADGGRNAAAIGLGVLGAAVVGSAIANSQPAPAYGGPVYYAPRPRCYWEQQPVWDPYIGANVYRNVKVCPAY